MPRLVATLFLWLLGGTLLAGCDSARTGSSSDVVGLQVSPANARLAAGSRQQFTATGLLRDGSTTDITHEVTWASSDPANVTITSGSLFPGLAISTASSDATISASYGTLVTSTGIELTGAKIVSLETDPPSLSMAVGTPSQLVATGVFDDNSRQDLTQEVAWTSSDLSRVTVGTTAVDAGVVTAVAAGSANVAAEWGGVTASTPIAVTSATLVSLEVHPTAPSIARGTSLQFSAVGTFDDMSTQDLTLAVSWTSSNTNVATISDVAGTKGLATGGSAGTATISAQSGGVNASTVLTVKNTVLVEVEVTPTNPTLAIGVVANLQATGKFSDNSTQDLTASATWSTSDPAVVSLNSAPGGQGLATSLTSGTATVTASAGGFSGSTAITVTPAQLVSIDVTPDSPTIAAGVAQQFTATGMYDDNSVRDLTASVAWSSSATGSATVSNAVGLEGLVSTLAVGGATIRADLGGVSGSTNVTVSAATLVSLSVTPVAPTIAIGTAVRFVATGTYSDTSTADLTAAATWSSSLGAIASVSNAVGLQGMTTSVSVGTCTISAAVGGVSVNTTLTVSAASLVSIAVTPNAVSLGVGLVQQFTATGTYSDTSTQNLTAAATWSSTAGTVATASNAMGLHGLATAVGIGNTTIQATVGGVTGTSPLEVIGTVSFRGASSGRATLLQTTLSLDTPAGVVAGDVMVASVACALNTATITPPAGWSLVDDVSNLLGNPSRLVVYSRVATAGEPAVSSWGISGHLFCVAGVAAFAGADPTNPVEVSAGVTTVLGLSHSAPPLTPTNAGGMLVTTHCIASAIDWTPPGGMLESFDAASSVLLGAVGLGLEGAYELRLAAGVTGVRVATAGNHADTGVAHSLYLRPAP